MLGRGGEFVSMRACGRGVGGYGVRGVGRRGVGGVRDGRCRGWSLA